MSGRAECLREVITQSCVAAVERCSCGTLHLVFGPFSLRLRPEQFRQLVDTLTDAQTQLDENSREQPAAVAGLASLLGRFAQPGES